MPFTYRSHYVPRLYLKNFASPSGQIYMYRLLVSRPQVPLWKRVHVGGVGYQLHLYTRIAFGGESDEIETWLNREFETPAEESIRKASNDARMDKRDWRNLINFVASQIVRTPAFLLRNLPHWHEAAPKILNDVMENARGQIELTKKSGQKISLGDVPNTEYFPFRITREEVPGEKMVKLRAEVVVGRGMWFYSMKHLLAKTATVLHSHRWSILTASDGLQWFTSDDPVITLNFRSDQKYDFKGGWNQQGSEILMPLSSKHLLYTQIGLRPPERGTIVSYERCKMIRRVIAEHAHRQIFSSHEDEELTNLRMRTVNADIVRDEKEQWGAWNEEQSKAETRLKSHKPGDGSSGQ